MLLVASTCGMYPLTSLQQLKLTSDLCNLVYMDHNIMYLYVKVT